MVSCLGGSMKMIIPATWSSSAPMSSSTVPRPDRKVLGSRWAAFTSSYRLKAQKS